MNDVAASVAAEIAGDPCPHCGAVARLLPNDALRWVCGACGGARVPATDARAHSAAEKAALQRSGVAAKRAFAWRVAGGGVGVTGAIVAALGIVLTGVSAIVGVIILAVSLALIVTAVRFGSNARRETVLSKRAAFEAWGIVGEALVRLHDGKLTAKEIAAMMSTTEADAERMLTLLMVDDRARIDVGEDAELRYRVTGAAAVDAPAVDDLAAPVATREETRSG